MRAIPCLPSWDTWAGPYQTYFLVRGCCQKNVEESKGQRKEEREGSVLGGVTSDTESQRGGSPEPSPGECSAQARAAPSP
jgi:hypothetical protein